VSTKKKSLVPLFGVAFIVAIVSTGIFYGLFVGKLNSASTQAAAAGLRVLVAAKPVPAGTALKAEHVRVVAWPSPPTPAGSFASPEEATGQVVVVALEPNEMITRGHLSSKEGAGAGLGIPDGMRAVSLMVHDSGGVVAMLKPGHRVDIQVVATMGGAGPDPRLRTVLENVRVLTIPRDPQLSRGNAQVVTVLANPREAAMLGLADSSARIRMVLRNPIDEKTENTASVALSSLFQGTAAASLRAAQPRPPVSPGSQRQMLVRVAGISPEQWTQIGARDFAGGSGLRLALLDKALPRAVEWLESGSLTLSPYREGRLHWTKSAYSIRLRATLLASANGRTRVRLEPEVATAGDRGVASQSFAAEVEMADTESLLVRWLEDGGEQARLWKGLFPARTVPADRQTVLVLSLQPAPNAAAAAAVAAME
jgi:Flp pilus assembly protein CpaB